MSHNPFSEFARADGSIDFERAMDALRRERVIAMRKIARGRARLFKPQTPRPADNHAGAVAVS